MLSILLLIPFIFAEYGRLPKSVLPIEYYLNLTFYFDGYGYEAPINKKDTFDGVVSIALNITEPVDRIVLHSKNLTFTENDCYIELMNWKINITKIEYDFENEQTILIMNITLYASSQKAVLYIYYSGSIFDDYRGIHKSTYVDEENTEKPIISTHFEPIYARRMVPCFDEPWMKAVWNVKITHPVGTRALSNMAEKYVKSFNYDMQTTIFFPTPLMSSYLLALTISDYEYVSNYSKSGTLVRIFAPNSKLGETKFAMEAALASLSYFENKFGIPYTLSKLDMFPINNFGSGAMENWGLVIFRTTALIGEANGYNIKRTVAHEIAHQWFGNLVTMDWYSELWLNEAFASMYQLLNPEKQDFNYLYGYDLAHNAANRMENPVRKHNMKKEDVRIDSYVSHYKSSKILFMLYQVIGQEKFEKGVSAYLKDNMYKAVNTTFLCSYLADAMPSGSPSISDFMDPWLEQVGLPFVDFENYNATHYEITQKRFDNGVLESYDERLPYPMWNYTWYIPLWFEQDKKKSFVWLKPGRSVVISKTMKLNPGFYKLNYTQFSSIINPLFYANQMFGYTSFGIETFSSLRHFIENRTKDIPGYVKKWAALPLVSKLHPTARDSLPYLPFDEKVSKREMEKYETTNGSYNLWVELKDLDNGVRVNSKFIIDNFDTISENDDLLFQVAKQSEGIGRTKLEELCKNHSKKSVKIVWKQFEKLEEWRKNFTEEAIAAVKLFEIVDEISLMKFFYLT